MGIKTFVFNGVKERYSAGSVVGTLVETVVRFLQFVFGIAVVGLYAQDVASAAKSGKPMDAKWVCFSSSVFFDKNSFEKKGFSPSSTVYWFLIALCNCLIRPCITLSLNIPSLPLHFLPPNISRQMGSPTCLSLWLLPGHSLDGTVRHVWKDVSH